MRYYPLGKTGIQASELSFGALPLQRRTQAEAVEILLRAQDSGINFYDTARGYTDSEQKIGAAFSGKRDQLYLASKVTGATTPEEVVAAAERSLRELKTDYVDILQFHNAAFVPRPGGEDGLYDTMLQLQQQGKTRFIGISCHKLPVALEAARSGLYATVQFPISYISSDEDLDLIRVCREHGVGLIAMKGLAGGLLSNAVAIYHFFKRFGADCRPIYGIQHMHELEDFLQAAETPMDEDTLLALIEKDKAELSGEFCRGCGYCLPCPANIPLNTAMRMTLMLKRAVPAEWLTPEWYAGMQAIPDCIHCGACHSRCPYGLNPPDILPGQYTYFMEQYAKHHG